MIRESEQEQFASLKLEKGRIRVAPVWGPAPAPPSGRVWAELMFMALAEAKRGAAQSEIPVGALVVKRDGQVLALTHNETLAANDPTAHAEILALRRAAQITGNHRLGGCFLVVTLEPCLMCVGAAREARVEGVVYGAEDVQAGAVSSCLAGLDLPLSTYRPWHYGGVEARACADVLRDFFADLR